MCILVAPQTDDSLNKSVPYRILLTNIENYIFEDRPNLKGRVKYNGHLI